MDLLEAGWRAAPHTPCTLCLFWAHVGTDGQCKGLLEEDCALWPFCLQDCQRRTFISTPPPGSGSAGTELLETPSVKRGTGQGFPPRGVWCCPVVLRGGRVGLSLYSYENSTPSRVQTYGHIQLCNHVWLFRGEQNLFAVSPKTHLTGLAQRI